MSRPPAERAAAMAAFLDAAAPGWAATLPRDGHPLEGLLAALEPHARRVGLDVPTYARAHGWIAAAGPAGPFMAAWHAELTRRVPGEPAAAVPVCAVCGAETWRPPALGAPVRCEGCALAARRQGVRGV
jgi:hypothetical protein